MYHCHVQSHSDMGMAGLLLVSNADGTIPGYVPHHPDAATVRKSEKEAKDAAGPMGDMKDMGGMSAMPGMEGMSGAGH
jgi:hypothetical protein